MESLMTIPAIQVDEALQTAKAPAEKEQLLPLTGLRLFLALWVIVYHQTSPDGTLGAYMPLLNPAFFSLVETGYAAVGVFFLLSGFILTYNYDFSGGWNKRAAIRFAIARFSRIYPVYLLGLVLVLPFFVKPLIRHPGTEGPIGALQFALLQSWVPAATGTWNSPGWSLSDEAFFYALFPVVGMCLSRVTRLPGLVVAGLFLWAAALLVPLGSVLGNVDGLNISAIRSNHHSFAVDFVRYFPIFRLPEFLLGIVTARIYLRIQHGFRGRGYYLYLPALAAAAIILTHANRVAYPLMHNGILAPLSACVVLGLALGGGALARILSIPLVVFLGGASFSMYILHLPHWSWMAWTLDHLHASWHRGWLGMVVYLVIVVVLSGLVFKHLEQPASFFLKRKLSREPSRA